MVSMAPSPTSQMAALDCSVGCFHAQLSVLQDPLTRYVTATRQRSDIAALPSELEAQYVNLPKAGVRMQLQFVRDQWDHYFAFQMSERVLHAVKLTLSFQTQSLYRPYAGSLPYERGAEMILRLLITFGATKGEVRRANAITAVLNGQHEPAPTNLTPIQVEDAMELTAPSFPGKNSSENESGSQADGCARGMYAPAGLSHEGDEAREPSVDGSINAPPPIAFDSTMGSSLPTFTSNATVKKASKELRAAKSCLELADYEEAVYWIDKELVRTKRKPHTHARLLVMRSHCWFELKQPQKAYDDAREALATETKSVGACGGVSTSLVKLERLSEAHSMCSAGRSIGSNEQAFETIGERNLSQGIRRQSTVDGSLLEWQFRPQ